MVETGSVLYLVSIVIILLVYKVLNACNSMSNYEDMEMNGNDIMFFICFS